jgi:hypothetical protein
MFKCQKKIKKKNEHGVQCLAVRQKANNAMQTLYAICIVVYTLILVGTLRKMPS